jgi:hypothetical protein
MEDKEFQQKLDKIVSKEPSKFIEESNLRVMAKEYSERHQDVSGNLGKYLVSAVFIDGYQTAQKQMYTEEEVIRLLVKRELFLELYDMANEYEDANQWFKEFKK